MWVAASSSNHLHGKHEMPDRGEVQEAAECLKQHQSTITVGSHNNCYSGQCMCEAAASSSRAHKNAQAAWQGAALFHKVTQPCKCVLPHQGSCRKQHV